MSTKRYIASFLLLGMPMTAMGIAFEGLFIWKLAMWFGPQFNLPPVSFQLACVVSIITSFLKSSGPTLKGQEYEVSSVLFKIFLEPLMFLALAWGVHVAL